MLCICLWRFSVTRNKEQEKECLIGIIASELNIETITMDIDV